MNSLAPRGLVSYFLFGVRHLYWHLYLFRGGQVAASAQPIYQTSWVARCCECHLASRKLTLTLRINLLGSLKSLYLDPPKYLRKWDMTLEKQVLVPIFRGT